MKITAVLTVRFTPEPADRPLTEDAFNALRDDITRQLADGSMRLVEPSVQIRWVLNGEDR